MAEKNSSDGTDNKDVGQNVERNGKASHHVHAKAVRSVSPIYTKSASLDEPSDSEQEPEENVQPVRHATPDASGNWDPFTDPSFMQESEQNSKHRYHHAKEHRTTIIVRVIVAIVVVLGIAAFGVYHSAQTVADDASELTQEANSFSKNLASGDTSAMNTSATRITDLTSEMNNEVSSPWWNIASVFPGSGADIPKVRALTGVANDLSTQVVTPIAERMSQDASGAIFSDGAINVPAFTALTAELIQVQPAIENASQQIDAIGPTSMDQINTPLQKVKTTLDGLDAATTELAKVQPYLPSLLGANGPRTYLIVAQNNSEIRSTGGFPGSRIPMIVDNGTITLGDYEPASGHFPQGTIPLTDEEFSVVGTLMQSGASFAPADVNVVPSFPRAAQLMEWCWNAEDHGDVDGVIALDPVFLQSMLKLTGGITTSDGTVVDGDNAAQVLLNQVYFLDPAKQDPFFSEVASGTMEKLKSSMSSINLVDAFTTIRDGITQGRLLAYMNNADEEQAVTALGADGEINQDAANPKAGFYIYDKTGSKLDWYLDMRSSVGEPTTNDDGSVSYPVTVTLHNTTTLDQMQHELTEYITGIVPESHGYGMITSFLAMAPAGGSISNFQIDADEVMNQGEATLYDHDVYAGYVNTLPSNTTTFTYTVTTAPNPASDLTLWTTPTGRSFA